MSPREIVAAVRALPGVAITSVGMRDAGQSDFKNRLRLKDLLTLAPQLRAHGPLLGRVPRRPRAGTSAS